MSIWGSLVSILWFSCGVAVPTGKGCNVVFSGRRGISRHSHVSEKVSKIVLCDGRNTVARFSEDDFHFSWQAQRFGGVHVHFARHARCFRRVVLRGFCQSHCQGSVKWWERANPVASVGHRERVVLRGRRSMWWTSAVCGMSFCVAGAVFGTLSWLQLRFPNWHGCARCDVAYVFRAILRGMGSTWWCSSLDSTLPTLPSTLSKTTLNISHLHSTLHTPHFSLHSWHSTSARSTIYTSHYAPCTPHYTLYTPPTPHYTLRFTLDTPHSTLDTPHSTLYTLHFTLDSALYTLHCALYS